MRQCMCGKNRYHEAPAHRYLGNLRDHIRVSLLTSWYRSPTLTVKAKMALTRAAPSPFASTFIPNPANRRSLANLLGASGIESLDLLDAIRQTHPQEKTPKTLLDPEVNSANSKMWVERMKNVMAELDNHTKCVPNPPRPLRFIDLGYFLSLKPMKCAKF
jgi:hypothetical protein